MALVEKVLTFARNHDTLIQIGFAVSVAWLAAGTWFVFHVEDWSPGERFTLESVGSFLEGVFAPLAFLWLVLGLFIQQRELANNTKALDRTSEQSAMQTHSIAATEMNARQETYFKIAESVKHQLGGLSGMLYISSMGPAGNGRMSRERMDEHFASAGGGDSEIFARLFLSQSYLEDGGLEELFYGTELRGQHCQNFIDTFDRLRRLAQNCDIDGIIEDSLMHSAFGLLYSRMHEHRKGE